jgi:hypothetical protein
VDNPLLYSPAPGPVTLAASTGPAGELVLHQPGGGADFQLVLPGLANP